MANKKIKEKPILKNIDEILGITETKTITKSPINTVSIKKLIHFKNHPFKLYEDERFNDMVESITANGIIVPIIIRPINDEIYEILSGHNRVEAAKVAGLEDVPVIIRENLSDDEALLIVTETNLIQRSFTDLAHSERAAALAVHHDAIKSQGKRTDLINEIENLLKSNDMISNNADFLTCSPVANKLKSVAKVGQEYGLSKDTVARYLRVNKLINELKPLVDNDKISIRAAVDLSYISEQAQLDLINILFENPEIKVDIKKAEILREYSENNNLDKEMINNILSGVAGKKKNRASLPVQSFKMRGKILSKYFKPGQKPEEIEAEIIEALEFYREYKKAKI